MSAWHCSDCRLPLYVCYSHPGLAEHVEKELPGPGGLVGDQGKGSAGKISEGPGREVPPLLAEQQEKVDLLEQGEEQRRWGHWEGGEAVGTGGELIAGSTSPCHYRSLIHVVHRTLTCTLKGRLSRTVDKVASGLTRMHRQQRRGR